MCRKRQKCSKSSLEPSCPPSRSLHGKSLWRGWAQKPDGAQREWSLPMPTLAPEAEDVLTVSSCVLKSGEAFSRRSGMEEAELKGWRQDSGRAKSKSAEE